MSVVHGRRQQARANDRHAGPQRPFRRPRLLHHRSRNDYRRYRENIFSALEPPPNQKGRSSLEHRNVKQHMGLEDPQNGWWRRSKGRRRNKKIPGPQPHKERGAKSVNRTVPFVLTIYALVVIWYFSYGCSQEDVKRARRRAPGYREKTEPSFGDMIAALRRHLWTERNFSEPKSELEAEKLNAAILDWMCAA